MNLSSSSEGWRGRVQSEGTFTISGKWGCFGEGKAGSPVGEPRHECVIIQKLPQEPVPQKAHISPPTRKFQAFQEVMFLGTEVTPIDLDFILALKSLLDTLSTNCYAPGLSVLIET